MLLIIKYLLVINSVNSFVVPLPDIHLHVSMHACMPDYQTTNQTTRLPTDRLPDYQFTSLTSPSPFVLFFGFGYLIFEVGRLSRKTAKLI